MIAVFENHPYLFSELPGFATAMIAVRLTRNRDFTRAALFSGLVCVPAALEGPTFSGYWHPNRLGGMAIGIEDLLFAFSTGVIAWMLAAGWGLDRCATGGRSFSACARRMLPLGIQVLADLGLWMAGVDRMSASLITSLGLLLVLLAWRPELWRLSACGMATFLIQYLLQLKLVFQIWPGFLDSWNRGEPWGRLFLGMPLGEIAWAAVFGATWPVGVAIVMDVRFHPRAIEAAATSNGVRCADGMIEGEATP